MKPVVSAGKMKPTFFVSMAKLAGLATLLVASACVKGGGVSRPVQHAPGAYVFALSTYAPSQRMATVFTHEIARDIVAGTGETRTDRATVTVSCQHDLIALSGPQVTKFDVRCMDTSSGVAWDATGRQFSGIWTFADGLDIEASTMEWAQSQTAQLAVLHMSAHALETLFGGSWQPGAKRDVRSSRMLWQLISPQLTDIRGEDAPTTLQFVGLAEHFATFTYRTKLTHDDLIVDVVGTIVLDARTGWPARLTVQADSQQDMAKVSLKVEKSISALP